MTGTPTRSRKSPTASACSARARPGRRAAVEQLEHRAPRPRACRRGHRDVVEGDAERLDVARWSGWLAITSATSAAQLAAAPAPQQVEQAVLLARGQQRDRGGGRRRPAASPSRTARRPRSRTRRAARSTSLGRQVELQAQEEPAALGVGGVLGRGDDVGAAVGEEAGTAATMPGRSRHWTWRRTSTGWASLAHRSHTCRRPWRSWARVATLPPVGR